MTPSNPIPSLQWPPAWGPLSPSPLDWCSVFTCIHSGCEPLCGAWGSPRTPRTELRPQWAQELVTPWSPGPVCGKTITYSKVSSFSAHVPSLCPLAHHLGPGVFISLSRGPQLCPGENPLPATASWPFKGTSHPLVFLKTSAPGRLWAERVGFGQKENARSDKYGKRQLQQLNTALHCRASQGFV